MARNSVSLLARAELPRRLNPRSTHIVDEVLKQVRGVGFCVVESVLPFDLTARIRAVLARLLRAERSKNAQPTGHQRIVHLLAKDPVFIKLLCNPLALAVWRKQLGKDALCSTLTANALWPGSTEQYWHADYPYWTFPQPYPVYPLSGQVIWMIDGFTESNGGTAAIPGSHRKGCLPSMGHEWCDDGVVLTGPPGSAIFSDGASWHTSRANCTHRVRYAVLVSYIRGYCVTQEEMSLQLPAIRRPSEEVQQLLGAKRYIPSRGFPY